MLTRTRVNERLPGYCSQVMPHIRMENTMEMEAGRVRINRWVRKAVTVTVTVMTASSS